MAIISAGIVKTDLVSAQDITGPNSLITAIAQKFNLNEADVKAVFEDQRTKREAQMRTRMEEKLTQAVTDGKITETQKQAILAKMDEMRKNRPNFQDFKNLTAEQRKVQRQQKKTDFENWAKQNGLDLTTLQSLIGHKGGFGIGGPMH